MSEDFDPTAGTPDQQRAAEKRKAAAEAAGVGAETRGDEPAAAKPKAERHTKRG